MTKVQELALILGSEDPEPDVGTTAEEMKALASAFGYAYDPKALTFQVTDSHYWTC